MDVIDLTTSRDWRYTEQSRRQRIGFALLKWKCCQIIIDIVSKCENLQLIKNHRFAEETKNNLQKKI